MEYAFNGKKQKLKFSGKVRDLLQHLQISDQIVIVKKNGRIITELDPVKDSDRIEIQRVIFGG
jgi:sulfur carrier protein ThiS